jgi:hypothetical protein
MVEFRFKPESKEKVLAAFEAQGPNRNPGVQFRGAWIGTRSDMAFVLAESEDQALIEKVAESWAHYGSYQIYPVVEVENY